VVDSQKVKTKPVINPKLIYAKIIITVSTLKNNPIFHMSETFTSLVAITRALGGVATGSINGQDADKAAAYKSIRGLKPRLVDRPARIGNKICAIAVLEANSDNTFIKIITNKIVMKTLGLSS
jgi:hypothetical protein